MFQIVIGGSGSGKSAFAEALDIGQCGQKNSLRQLNVIQT